MSAIVEFVVQAALQIALTAWVIRRDLRRLAPDALDRAWNDASFWVAVVLFSPLCIPVHFTRTRRSFAGFALGMLWLGVVMAALFAVAALMP